MLEIVKKRDSLIALLEEERQRLYILYLIYIFSADIVSYDVYFICYTLCETKVDIPEEKNK
jgi:hypothetical protein